MKNTNTNNNIEYIFSKINGTPLLIQKPKPKNSPKTKSNFKSQLEETEKNFKRMSAVQNFSENQELNNLYREFGKQIFYDLIDIFGENDSITELDEAEDCLKNNDYEKNIEASNYYENFHLTFEPQLNKPKLTVIDVENEVEI